jgi:hypothetical protein
MIFRRIEYKWLVAVAFVAGMFMALRRMRPYPASRDTGEVPVFQTLSRPLLGRDSHARIRRLHEGGARRSEPAVRDVEEWLQCAASSGAAPGSDCARTYQPVRRRP